MARNGARIGVGARREVDGQINRVAAVELAGVALRVLDLEVVVRPAVVGEPEGDIGVGRNGQPRLDVGAIDELDVDDDARFGGAGTLGDWG
jgi:hypothetical protein